MVRSRTLRPLFWIHLTILLAVTGMVLTGGARACISYQDYIHWVGTQRTPENRRIAVQGDSLYVVHKTAGLKIFDLADPMIPAPVDSLELPGVIATRVLPNDSLVGSNSHECQIKRKWYSGSII